MHKYPTNLTDKQWQVIKNMLDPKERFRKYSRAVENASLGFRYMADSVLLFQ